MRTGRNVGRAIGTLSVLALGAVVAFAGGGPGTSLQSVKDKQGASQAEKDYAECLCEIIDGVPAGPNNMPPAKPPCLPKETLPLAQGLKQKGCLKVATVADLEAHYTAIAVEVIKQDNPGASSAAVATAAAKVGKAMAAKLTTKPADGKADNRAAAINENAGWAAFIFPNPFGLTANEFVKKSLINDECQDMVTHASTDPALKPWAGGGDPAFASNFGTGIKVYVNLKSAIADINFLLSLEPTAPPAGAPQSEKDKYEAAHKEWAAALNFADTILAGYLKNLCAILDWFTKNGKGPDLNAQVKLLNDCKVEGVTCRESVKNRSGYTPVK